MESVCRRILLRFDACRLSKETGKERIQVSKFDFRPLSEQEKKMNDPAVKQAIRTLKAKGITIKQIEEAFRYYERLKRCE